MRDEKKVIFLKVNFCFVINQVFEDGVESNIQYNISL